MKILGSLITVIFLITNIGKSVDLTCNRLERHYVTCQQDSSNLYGLWSVPTISFRVTGAEVEEYEKQDEDSSYYIYKLYLHAGKKKIHFYEYGSNHDDAYSDKQRVLDFLSGANRGTFMSLNRRSNIFQDVFVVFVIFGLIAACIKRSK